MRSFVKGFVLVALLVLAISSIYADTTDVPAGQVFGTWTIAGSPYLIGGNVTVPRELTLTIGAGVKVIFDSTYQFSVDSAATLLVQGTAEDSVIFTQSDVHFPARNWKGLMFYKASPSTDIAYAVIEWSSGTGLTLTNSNINIHHCTIISNHNTGDQKGGGIECVRSNAIIEYNNIFDNVGTQGGGINCINSDVVIKYNYFKSNRANLGGGLYVNSGDVDTVEVIGNTFEADTANHSGGAVLLRAVPGNNFGFNILHNNVAQDTGAGLQLADGHIRVYNNTIVGNHSNNVGGGVSFLSTLYGGGNSSAFTNNIVWGNSATNGRRVIIIKASNPVITYADIDTNIAGTGNINSYPMFVDSLNHNFGLLYGSPCIDAGNDTYPKDPDSSRVDIGAIPYYHPNHLLGDIYGSLSPSWNPYYIMAPSHVPTDSTLIVQAGVIIKSKSLSYGIIIDTNATLTVAGTGANPVTLTAYDTTVGWKGLVFRNADSSSRITYAKLEFAKSSAVKLTNSDITIENSSFRKNSSNAGGGAVTMTNSTPKIRQTVFTNNTADQGGALFIEGGGPAFTENTFTANHSYADGGALYIDSDTCRAEFSRNVFQSNTAGFSGGAINCALLISPKFTNNTFYGNEAGQRGGALSFGDFSKFAFKNNICWANFAPTSSQISSVADSVFITYCDIPGTWTGTGNINLNPKFINPAIGDFNLPDSSPCVDAGEPPPDSPKDPDSTRTDMGAKYFNQGRIQLDSVIWGTLYADSSPYGVICDIRVPPDSSLTIQAGVILNFTGNYKVTIDTGAVINCVGNDLNNVKFTAFDTSNRWGGLVLNLSDSSSHIGHTVFEYAGTTALKINKCYVLADTNVFQYNVNPSGPGAIECDSSNATISANTFYDNHQGAIKVLGGSPMIKYNLFRNNKTSANGGAIQFAAGAIGITSFNVFWNNQADIMGGAISCANITAGLQFLNNTFYDNQAYSEGGGITLDNSFPVLINDIFWADYASNNPEIDPNNLSVPAITYCDVSGNYSGTGNINSDPLFVNPASGNFHIQEHSPCIDAGDSSLPKDPDNTRADMGAFYYAHGSSYTYLPGDINGDKLLGGGDVTYGVRFFKLIGNRPPDSCYLDSTSAWLYCAGDVNGNCEFRGSDITYLVAYFKLLNPTLKWCHWTPPFARVIRHEENHPAAAVPQAKE